MSILGNRWTRAVALTSSMAMAGCAGNTPEQNAILGAAIGAGLGALAGANAYPDTNSGHHHPRHPGVFYDPRNPGINRQYEVPRGTICANGERPSPSGNANRFGHRDYSGRLTPALKCDY